ncbi:MAG: GSCFA domain-containing protein [Bacteroidaceae bacterium]|nr:GSCFA domain-containing protein [Bacteroidaceae bacterium]
MQFTTPIHDFGQTFRLTGSDKILALGSCFAQVVGQRLADNRLDIAINPTGVLYNPESIFLTLDTALDIAQGNSDVLQQRLRVMKSLTFEAPDGRWYNWMAASLIQGQSREECDRRMADVMEHIAQRLNSLTVLMLTFGTDHYYSLNGQCTVANCHKMPAAMFEERILTIDEIVRRFDTTCRRLIELRPELKILVSVSPYRYLKYGLHVSQLSKARLLLATDEIQKRHSAVCYFPAYEILNDELRDYRYYAADMVHPSETAEEYIWQTFCNHYIDQRLSLFFQEWAPVLKLQSHRTKDTATQNALCATLSKKTEQVKQQFPEMFLDTDN